jgi:hypothetical protein
MKVEARFRKSANGLLTAFLQLLWFFVCTSAQAWEAGQGDVPLPEHPRPDWERVEWLNLNGW